MMTVTYCSLYFTFPQTVWEVKLDGGIVGIILFHCPHSEREYEMELPYLLNYLSKEYTHIFRYPMEG